MRELIQRGRAFYGVDVGILLLDTGLPRARGDIAHGDTFSFPVAYAVVEGATPRLVVERGAEGTLEAFVAAGQRLIEDGVSALSTSCGFTVILQKDLSDRLPVPVATSSLLQVPQALRLAGESGRVGIVTANGSTLTNRHFAGAGISGADCERLRIIGLEDTANFYPPIVGEAPFLDVEAARLEVVEAAERAIAEDAMIRSFVFECTNLPPYADAVRAATGRPVWDAVGLVRHLHAGVQGGAIRDALPPLGEPHPTEADGANSFEALSTGDASERS